MNRPFKTLDATSATIAYSGGAVKSIRGYNPVAAVSYLQLFDAAALPADTGVPLWVSNPIPASVGYEFELDDPVIFRTGIIACLSSTAATKTLVNTASNFLGMVETSEPAGLVLVTNDTADELDIWSGSTTYRLYRLKVTDLGAAAPFIQLFRSDAHDDGAVPAMQWPVDVSGSGEVDLCFGPAGLLVSKGGSTDCYVASSSTSNVLTKGTEGTGNWKAWIIP